MEKKMFFFPCQQCYTKLVNDISEVGQDRICSGCKQSLTVPPPPKRIPPFAEIREVSHSAKTNKKNVIIICPYCANNQKVSPEHCGKKIYCNCCKIIIEIPKHSVSQLKLRLSHDTIVADGKSVVTVTAETIDQQGIPIPGQKINFSVYRERGNISEVQEVTNDRGEAAIGYTTTIYSGETTFRARLDSNKEVYKDIVLREIDGIGDGKITLKSIDFATYEEGSQELKGQIVLHNPGKDIIVLEQATLTPTTDEYSDEVYFEIWQSNINEEIKDKSDYVLPITLSKKSDVTTISFLRAKLEITGFNKETDQKIIFQKELLPSIETIGKLCFQATTEQDTIEAGSPFSLSVSAIRDEEIDTNLSENIDFEFAVSALSSQSGHNPQFPEKETITFRNGQGQTTEKFLFFAQQTDANIQVKHNGVLVAECTVNVVPAKIPQFDIELTSPQTNHATIEGDNLIILKDNYGNSLQDFKEPILLSLYQGVLKKNNKIITQLEPTNGIVDLTQEQLTISIKDFSNTNNQLIVRYKDIKQKKEWQINPEPLEVALQDLKISESTLQHNQAYTAKINFSQSGDGDFTVSAIQWYELLETETEPSPEQINSIDLENISKTENEIEFSFLVPELMKSGSKELLFFVTIENSLNQEQIKLPKLSIPVTLQPKERKYIIKTDDAIVAGKPFDIEITACCEENTDHQYEGNKLLYIHSDCDLPEQIEATFQAGIATLANFNVTTAQKYQLQIKDDSVASGETELEVIPDELDNFDIVISSQKGNYKIIGENYITAKDKHNNIITNFNKDVVIKFQNNSSRQTVIKGSFFAEGKANINKSDLVLTKKPLQKTVELSFQCENVQQNHTVEMVPQAGDIVLNDYSVCENTLAPGSTCSLEIALFNNGETDLQLEKMSLQLLQNGEWQSVSIEPTKSIIAPQKIYKESISHLLPTDMPCGKVDIYLAISFLCNKEQVEYTFKNPISISLEHKPREVKIIPPQTITADDFFAVDLEIYHQDSSEIDTTFEGAYDVFFTVEPGLTNQSTFPKKTKLTFAKGTARTEELFGLFSNEHEYSCEAKIAWFQDIISKINFPSVVAGQARKFNISIPVKQIANQSFNGQMTIQVEDHHGNTLKNFADAITIESSGNGVLTRKGQPFVVTAEEFVNGIATIEGKELVYATNSSRTEKINMIINYNDTTFSHALEITPAPAIIKIEEVSIANEKVQWDEDNYMLFIKVKHVAGAECKVTDLKIDFFYENIQQTGYQVTIQKNIPVIKPGESSNISAIVGLDKSVHIGQNRATISLEYEDSYYKTKNTIHANHSGWLVEPCDRKIEYSPEKFHAWKPFALNLFVTLDGKLDTSYSGRHILLCSCKNTQDLQTSYEVPRSLELFFSNGKCKTQEVFTFFESAKDLRIEFYETEIGGASGEIKVDIHNELFSHACKRFLQKTLFFCKQHKHKLVVAGIVFTILLLTFIHWRTVKETQSLTVAQIEGVVTVEGKRLKIGDTVFQYQNVVVAKDSFCILQTKNGGTFKLYSSADVYIQSLGRGITTFEDKNYENFVDVRKGDVSYQNKKQSTDYPQIAIPDADKVDLQSNEFRVGVTENGSRLSIYQGKAALSSGGKTVQIAEGEGSSVKKGEEPSEPSKLPTPPVWKLPETGETINSNAVSFEWYPVENIESYTLEVYHSDLESVPVLSKNVNDNKEKIKTLHDGSFVPQKMFSIIQSVDQTGFVSAPSNKREFIHHVESDKCELAIIATDKNNSPINLENILIDGKPYQNGVELEPKKYRLVIKKPGYEDYEEEVELVKGQPFFSRKLELKPKPRKMHWQMEADIFLDEINYNMEKILINKEKVEKLPDTLLPGDYQVDIECFGFSIFSTTLNLQPAEEEEVVPIHLKATEREIINKIVTDTETSNPVTFQIETKVNPTTIKPGIYRLQINCEGFVVVNKSISIPIGTEPFVIEETIEAKERNVIFSLDTSPWNVDQQNLEILATNETGEQRTLFFQDQQKIKPGIWKLQLNIKDYEPIQEEVIITPKDEAFQYDFVAKAKPVDFNLILKSSIPVVDATIEFKSASKKFTLPYTPTMKIESDTYQIKIISRGHHDKEMQLVASPGLKSNYTITLDIKKVLVAPFVIDRSNNIQDKIVAILYQNQRIVEPLALQPGNLEIRIQLENYGEITSRLQIPMIEETFQIYDNILGQEPERELSFNMAQFVNSENLGYQGSIFRIDSKSYNLSITENNIRNIPGNKVTHKLNYFEAKTSAKAQKLKIQVAYYVCNYDLKQYREMATLNFDEIDCQALIDHLNKILFPPDKVRRIESTFRNLENLKKPKEEDITKLKEYVQDLEAQTQRSFALLLKRIDAWK